MAGLAAELEDQNVINEGYLSSAECNALVVSTCRAPLRKVTRLVRPPAGADDHMVRISWLTQSNSITHQALVVELFRGGEVTQTGVVSHY